MIRIVFTFGHKKILRKLKKYYAKELPKYDYVLLGCGYYDKDEGKFYLDIYMKDYGTYEQRTPIHNLLTDFEMMNHEIMNHGIYCESNILDKGDFDNIEERDILWRKK